DNPQNFETVKANIGPAVVDHITGSGDPKRADYKPPDGNFKDIDVLNPRQEAAAAAMEVSDSLHLWNQPERLEKALRGKSPAEIAAIDDEFKKAHGGQSMEDYIKKETKADSVEQRKALALLHPETHVAEAMDGAKEVHDSLRFYNEPARL